MKEWKKTKPRKTNELNLIEKVVLSFVRSMIRIFRAVEEAKETKDNKKSGKKIRKKNGFLTLWCSFLASTKLNVDRIAWLFAYR